GNIQAGQFERNQKKVKLHAHCYQKAFQLDGISKEILNIPEGYSVDVIPSGCCGMAGSFGYEKEHYKVSMQVADLVLIPTLKRTPDEELVAAPGLPVDIKFGMDFKGSRTILLKYFMRH